MILAYVWFVILMLISFGVAYATIISPERRGNEHLPGSFFSVVISSIAILVTWEEIGRIAGRYIWGLLLPHDAGSSLALITAALLVSAAFVVTVIAPNVCAYALVEFRSRNAKRGVAQ